MIQVVSKVLMMVNTMLADTPPPGFAVLPRHKEAEGESVKFLSLGVFAGGVPRRGEGVAGLGELSRCLEP